VVPLIIASASAAAAVLLVWIKTRLDSASQVRGAKNRDFGALPADQAEAAIYNAVFAYGGVTFCESCKRFVDFTSSYTLYTDESYREHAKRLWNEGWSANEGLALFCPDCTKAEKLKQDSRE
jgi:hypothetical protein